MNDLFQQTRDTVMAVDAAWDRLPEILAQHETDLATLETLAGSLGKSIAAELANARQRLTALRDLAEADPLTALEHNDELTPLLRTLRTRLEEQVKERDEVREELATANDLLHQLEETQRKACASAAEGDLKVQVDDPVTLPQPADDGQLAAQRTWLAKLEATVAEGKFHRQRGSAARWTSATQQLLTATAAAQRASQALLCERRIFGGCWTP